MRILAMVATIGCLCFTAPLLAQTNSAHHLELHVRNVFYVHELQSPVVILEDREHKRFLPIFIGISEARSIATEMHHIKPPRPMTHDLFSSLVHELDATVDKVVITETQKNTYYARLIVSSRGKTKDIDCRPSDGIAIALRSKAPILVAVAVMENALPVPVEESDAQDILTLGITVQTLTPDLAAAFDLGKTKGVLVSASERKEFQRGDVIAEVNESPIESADQLHKMMRSAKPGRSVKVELLRSQKTIVFDLRIEGEN